MVVDVTTVPTFTRGQPRLLFEGEFSGTVPIRSYDISLDGQRFVMTTLEEAESEAVTSIKIVQNWVEELKARVPVN